MNDADIYFLITFASGVVTGAALLLIGLCLFSKELKSEA
jgi:hypothetical protein